MKAVVIPVEQGARIEVVDVGHDWQDFAAAIGEPCEYIELVRCPLTPDYSLVLIVDENGLFDGQKPNHRAWSLYPVPGAQLHGTVLVMQEGDTPEGRDLVDLKEPERALRLVETFLG